MATEKQCNFLQENAQTTDRCAKSKELHIDLLKKKTGFWPGAAATRPAN
uniref:Uncharacterized protein n=1 Tax=Arundo donax TaxID=35708 RepID=A0A0A8XNU0_ARUDO